eukprot:493566-Hanusia_phi.AAC.1
MDSAGRSDPFRNISLFASIFSIVIYSRTFVMPRWSLTLVWLVDRSPARTNVASLSRPILLFPPAVLKR